MITSIRRSIFTGTHLSRLSPNRRLSLPPIYQLSKQEVWFLLPNKDGTREHQLHLHPGSLGLMQRAIKQATGTECTEPSIEDMLCALRLLARQTDMPMDAVSAFIPVRRSNHITLSREQTNWLQTERGHIKLTGALSYIVLQSTAARKCMMQRYRDTMPQSTD